MKDKRPNWRDPNLPVIRDYRMPDGSKKVEVEPDYEQRYRAFLLQSAGQPSYRNDPTYNMKRKRK